MVHRQLAESSNTAQQNALKVRSVLHASCSALPKSVLSQGWACGCASNTKDEHRRLQLRAAALP
jgi:hypothetical protein